MALFTTFTHYNYSDRIIKVVEPKASTRRDADPLTTPDISFNPNDGIYTKQIVNQYRERHNYAIVTEGNEYTYTYTRWFIIDAKRLRTGQYELTLKRDVIADYYENVLNSTFLIEKGTPQLDSPLAFNRESISFNQIKFNDDIELKDTSGVQWIYAYIPKNTVIDDSINVPSSSSTDDTSIYIGSDITKWKYNTNKFIGFDPNLLWTIRATFSTITGGAKVNMLYRFNYNDGSFNSSKPSAYAAGLSLSTTKGTSVFIDERASQIEYYNTLGGWTTFFTALKEILTNYHDANETNEYLSYDGKIVRDATGYYKVSIAEIGTQKYDDIKEGTTLFNLLSAFVNSIGFTGTPNNNSFEWDMNAKIYQTILIPIEQKATSFKLSGTRKTCNDALYDIVAFPFDNGKGETIGGYLSANNMFMCQYDVQRNGATALGTVLGDKLYDIQFLPYAPFSSNLIKKYGTNNYINLSLLEEDKDYTIIKDGDGNSLGLLFYLSTSNYNFIINQEISLTKTTTTTTTTTSISQKYYATSSATAPVNIATFDLSSYNNVQNVRINSVIRTISGVSTDVSSDCGEFYFGGICNVNYLKNIIHTGTDFTFTTTITFENDIIETTDDVEAREKQLIYKISNECDLYRIVSPNYASTFEFSPSKNDGVDHFDVQMTLRPINPFIHIKPHFKSLYGINPQFDARGLILSGDFSFGQLQDNFINYELNNKNYQEIFNRQIEKMDFDNKMGKIEAVTGAIGGTIQAAGQSAAMGGLVGGVSGAVIGGIAGGLASGIGGIADVAIYDKKVLENRRFAQDIYNYQLGNIKALPYTLTRINAQTINYHIFPFIEIFTATDEEKEILKNKLKYDGWTLMTIDTLKNYLIEGEEVYIKGQLIRSYRDVVSTPITTKYNGLFGEDNIIKEIALEISKGVYL